MLYNKPQFREDLRAWIENDRRVALNVRFNRSEIFRPLQPGSQQGPDSGEKGLDHSPASVNRYGQVRAEVHFSKDDVLEHQPLVKSKRHWFSNY